MFALIVTFDVAEEHAAAFRAEALAHAARCLEQEAGCQAFEVLQAEDNPARFLFYEVYADKKAFEEEHNKTPYLAAFRERVTPWVRGSERGCWVRSG